MVSEMVNRTFCLVGSIDPFFRYLFLISLAWESVPCSIWRAGEAVRESFIQAGSAFGCSTMALCTGCSAQKKIPFHRQEPDADSQLSVVQILGGVIFLIAFLVQLSYDC